MPVLPVRPFFGVLLALLLAAPATAQYIYLDANGDGVNTSADLLSATGTTTLDVWLSTDKMRDGSAAACPTGEELTINTYEFILRATNGQMNWGSYTNLIVDNTLSFGLGSSATEYHNGFGGGPILAPGTYHLGTLQVSVALGTPSLSFASSSPTVSPYYFTSFGSQCPGVDFDNTMKFGYDWFDSDGVAYGGSPQAAPVLDPIADMSVDEGQVGQQSITATDADGQSLLFEKAAGPVYMVVATTDPGSGTAHGTITVSPGILSHGSTTGAVRVTDGLASDQKSFAITIVDVNTGGPRVFVDPVFNISAGLERQMSFSVSDPDLDPVRIEFGARPPYVSYYLYPDAQGPSGLVSSFFVTPTPGDVGRGYVVIDATDGFTTTHTRVEINVTGTPLSPEPPPDLFSAVYTVQELGAPGAAIGMGDFDGDGDADAAISSTVGRFVEIYSSDGRGGLDLVERISEPSPGPIAVGDFDRDGFADVASLETSSEDVIIYRGPFTGATAPSQRIHVGQRPVAMTLGDVNRDGSVDLLVVERGSAKLARFMNDGAGNFGAAIEHSTTADPVILTTADFDADGWLDVAVFCKAPGTFDILTNQGGGGFVLSLTQPIDPNSPSGPIDPLAAVTYTDRDDGQTTMAIAARGRSILTLKRTTAGNFVSNTYLLGRTASVATADLRRTGSADLIAGSDADDPATLYLGLGRNYVSFAGATGWRTIPQSGGTINAIASGDVDRDGRPDVITLQDWKRTGIAAVYRTQEDGRPGAATILNMTVYGNPVLGDFNNDGHLDIAGGTSTALGAGDGTFPTILFTNTYFGLDGENFASDVNRDGILDLISVPACCNDIFVRLGDGTGNFHNAPGSPVHSTLQQGRGFAVGDFNEDGTPDFFVSAGTYLSPESAPFEYWSGRGDGSFDGPVILPVGTLVGVLRAVDVDADGHLDVTFPQDRSMSWLRGHGDGTFDSPEPITGPGAWSHAFAWGNLNGDARPDLAFVRFAANATLGTMLQLSDQTFAPPRYHWSQDSFGSIDLRDLEIVDVNGDGRSDLVSPYMYGVAVGLGFGNGGVSQRRVIGPGVGSMTTGDVDEDGWPDIVMGGTSEYNVYNPTIVFHNNSDLVNRRAARAFLTGGDNGKTIPIGAAGRNLCLRVEPVGGSYENVDLDPTSVVMKSKGTGVVSQITAVAGKKLVLGDMDGNGIQEFAACFESSKLAQLFSKLQGRRTVPVVVEGRILGGGRMHAELSLTIVRTGPSTAPSLSPNPLNPTGVFRFATTRPGIARIRLYDVQGRLIRTLVDRQLPAGDQEVFFDGRDRDGRSLASGVYFARIETTDGSYKKRVAIVK